MSVVNIEQASKACAVGWLKARYLSNEYIGSWIQHPLYVELQLAASISYAVSTFNDSRSFDDVHKMFKDADL